MKMTTTNPLSSPHLHQDSAVSVKATVSREKMRYLCIGLRSADAKNICVIYRTVVREKNEIKRQVNNSDCSLNTLLVRTLRTRFTYSLKWTVRPSQIGLRVMSLDRIGLGHSSLQGVFYFLFLIFNFLFKEVQSSQALNTEIYLFITGFVGQKVYNPFFLFG